MNSWKSQVDLAFEQLEGKNEFKLPTQEQLYKNPIKAIHIDKPTWYGIQGDVLEVVRQFLVGYLWEMKFSKNFVAYHREQEEVENLLHKIVFLQDDKRWWPSGDEEIQLALIDFARLVPKMWD